MRFLRTFEAKLRGMLGRHRILYAFVAGVGIVLFWRGVWYLADFFSIFVLSFNGQTVTIDWAAGIDGLISVLFSSFLLISTGLFVSELMSGSILMTDIKKEEKVVEKTEQTVVEESAELPSLEKEIQHIAAEVQDLEKRVHKN